MRNGGVTGEMISGRSQTLSHGSFFRITAYISDTVCVSHRRLQRVMRRVVDGCHEGFIESCVDECSHLGNVYSRLLIRNIFFRKLLLMVKQG
jgi:hypothetical protein